MRKVYNKIAVSSLNRDNAAAEEEKIGLEEEKIGLEAQETEADSSEDQPAKENSSDSDQLIEVKRNRNKANAGIDSNF